MNAISPTISYYSNGTLLIYGAADRLQAVLAELPSGFKVLGVCAGEKSQVPSRDGVEIVPGVVLEVKGHLGAFRARAAAPGGGIDLGALSPNRDAVFDLVLDLYRTPLIGAEVSPIGYAHVHGEDVDIGAVLQDLAQLRGDVRKPRYFHFDEARCAHDRLGLKGCRECRSVCPAAALASGGRGIEIDPYLCQGCGTCMLACPTGALTHAQYPPKSILEQMGEAIAVRRGSGNTAPSVLVHAGGAPRDLPEWVVPIETPTPASVSLDLWFAALAMGASQVLILRPVGLPRATWEVLQKQLEDARQWLLALGQVPERIRLIHQLQGVEWEGLAPTWDIEPVDDFVESGGKRERLRLALQTLHADKARAVGYNQGPYGRVRVDDQSCSLCEACVGVCQPGALQLNAGALMHEAWRCTQCGLCAEVCPEKVVTLEPGLFPETFLAVDQEILKAPGEQVLCVECGKPVGDVALYRATQSLVADHPIFQGEGAKLLQMCMACRQHRAAQFSLATEEGDLSSAGRPAD